MMEREPVEQRNLPDFRDELERTYGFLPYSDLGRWLPWEGFYESAFENLPLGRLNGVRALSFLSYIGSETNSVRFLEYTHTRFDHSLGVALVSEEILKRNGFPQEDINLGIIAGLTHDNGLPAYGDATKKIDPEALDEETHCWESLGKKGQNYVKNLGISREMLEPIIRNEGIRGQVLDISDRITYTMKDLHITISETDDIYSPTLDPRLLPIRYLLSHGLNIGNIYKEIGVDRKKQEVFFNNPKHLNIFLLLRAHLHQMLYLNPINQGRDLFIKHLIEPMYSRTGDKPLNPEILRNMTDENLLTALQRHYRKFASIPNGLYYDLTNWYPSFKKFQSVEDARAFEKKLKRKKDIAIIDKPYTCKGFDPGTSYKVVNEKGNIEPFREFHHMAAREIENIEESTKGVFVFYANVSEDNSVNNLLRTIFMQNG